MSTLSDRPNTALLVIDVQNDVMAGTHNRDAVVANIAALVDRARPSEVPVVWVQHSGDEHAQGSDGWQYVPELTQGDGRAGGPQALPGLVRGDRPRGGARRAQDRAAWSSPGRRPTSASGRPCTGRSSGATTPLSSATRTPPRTSASGAPRRRTRSSTTRTCTGATTPLRVGRQGR